VVNDGRAAIRKREISHVDRVLVILVEFIVRHEEIVVTRKKEGNIDIKLIKYVHFTRHRKSVIDSIDIRMLQLLDHWAILQQSKSFVDHMLYAQKCLNRVVYSFGWWGDSIVEYRVSIAE